MISINKINTIIEKFGLNVVNSMKQELQKKKGNNTGRLLNSINFKFKASIDKILIQFVSEDYGKYVDEGRKPGKYPPISKIKEWTKSKGLPEKAAFPIAKNIFKFGIKQKPFLGVPLKKNRQDFVVGLIGIFEKEIIADVKKTLKP
jgi:hypothetical protein